MMFIEKVENQKLELGKAQDRHDILKINCDALEEECVTLKGRVALNQESISDSNEKFLILMNEMTKQRYINFDANQRLQIAREHIDMLLANLEKLKTLESNLQPIDDEQLSFKMKVVDCLQDMLIKLRLRSAESNELITDLKNNLKILEKDVEIMKSSQPGSVSHWQQELISSKIRTQNVMSGFEKIRNEITEIKNNLAQNMMFTDSNMDEEDNFSINFKMWDSKKEEVIKLEKNKSNSQITVYENELDFLKFQIKNLDNQREYTEKRMELNEQLKENLKYIIESISSRERKTFEEIDNLNQKYKLLEAKMDDELQKVNVNINEKIATISNLQTRVKNLQTKFYEEKIEETLDNYADRENSKITQLEDEVKKLEQRVYELKSNREELNEELPIS